MYRLFVLIVLGLCVSAGQLLAIQASEGPALVVGEGSCVALSLRGSVTLVEGEAREIVYKEGSDYLSELIWDISSLWMVGGVASLQIDKYLRINAGVWTGVTEGDGMMQDYDWLSDVWEDDWSHYSESEVKMETATVFDLNASLHVLQWQGADFYGIVGYKYNVWEWSDSAGRYEYSSNPNAAVQTEAAGWRDEDGTFGGVSGIDYEQTFHIPYAGVGLAYSRDRFGMSAYLVGSVFVMAEDKDHHILRDLRFEETFDSGNYIAFGCEATMYLTDTWFVSAALDAQHIPEFRGDMTIYPADGSVIQEDNRAGIENTVAALTLTAGLRF